MCVPVYVDAYMYTRVNLCERVRAHIGLCVYVCLSFLLYANKTYMHIIQ